MRELINELKQFYVLPLSQLYYDRIALEKAVFRSPLFVRISDPDSWLAQAAYTKFKALTPEQLEVKIKSIISYLTPEDKGVVFEGDRVLTLNDSVPYIEWKDDDEFYALTDFLGKYSLFIDVNEFDGECESMKNIIKGLHAVVGDSVQIFLMNSEGAMSELKENCHAILIKAENVTTASFAERFNFRNRSRNGLALFNFGSKPYFMMGPNGKLVTFFGKQEQSALIDEIKNIIR